MNRGGLLLDRGERFKAPGNFFVGKARGEQRMEHVTDAGCE
jgi:hypothetical protein